MGLCTSFMRFDGPPPDATRVAAAMTDVCGLAVTVVAEGSQTFLQFTAAPGEQVEYRCRGTLAEVISFVGMEGTTHGVAVVAVETLGGRPAFWPVSDEYRAAYARPISVSELRQQRRRNSVVILPLVVLMIPVWGLFFTLFALIAMANGAERANRWVRRKLRPGEPGA